MAHAHATTDHERIKQWVEQRGGHPAAVTSTGEHGLLRIDFEPADESLEPIGWGTFFETFDQKELAFLYQDTTTGGQLSRFNKFIDRNSVEASDLTEIPDEEAAPKRRGSQSRKPTRSKSSTSRSNRETQSSANSDSGGNKRQASRSADGAEEINVREESEVEEEIEDQLDDED